MEIDLHLECNLSSRRCNHLQGEVKQSFVLLGTILGDWVLGLAFC